jgi:hypothetical protein
VSAGGTYSNGIAGRPITMADLLETKAKLDALGPIPPADITVAYDVADQLRDLAPPSAVRAVSTLPPSTLARPLGGIVVHVDERLPPGTWHPGLPLP